MIKPKRLNHGDYIATISPSWGIAGESKMIARYRLGVKNLESNFGVNVINAPNALRGEKYLRDNPKARADDLMWSFDNKRVNGIIANIGGNNCDEILPFIDIDILKNSPKVFIGCSDIFTIHTLCLKSELVSFYGGNLLTTISSKELHPYTMYWMEKALFDINPIGAITNSKQYSFNINLTNNSKCKSYNDNGYEILSGKGTVKGNLIIITSELIKIQNSKYKIPKEKFIGSILCFEDIIECVTPEFLSDFILWLYNEGILQNISGLVVAKFNQYPQDKKYKEIIVRTLKELGIHNLAVLYGLGFGHTSPKVTLPYGVMAKIDCDLVSFSIVENHLCL